MPSRCGSRPTERSCSVTDQWAIDHHVSTSVAMPARVITGIPGFHLLCGAPPDFAEGCLSLGDILTQHRHDHLPSAATARLRLRARTIVGPLPRARTAELVPVMRHRTRMASACCNVKESLEVFCEASPQHCNQDLAPGCDFGGKDQPARSHPLPAPDDVRAHAGESPPQSLAPGLIEEAVSRFALPWSFSLTRDSGWLSNNVETLVEELETEAETLWQMGALAFATLQRIAHDQAGAVGKHDRLGPDGVIHAFRRDAIGVHRNRGRSWQRPPFPHCSAASMRLSTLLLENIIGN